MKSIAVAITVAIAITLSSCSLLGKEIPSDNKNVGVDAESYAWINETHSSYGYNQLEDRLKKAYDDIVDAWLKLEKSIITEKISGDELSDITNNILHDYPIITWIDKQYSYKNIIIGTKINFKYTITDAELKQYVTDINSKADDLVENISPDTTDFEKSVIVHDMLVKMIDYDKDAERQDQAYGAIIGKRATCQGYAKAYQLLMLKLGVDTIIVFGDSTGPHAWNMLKLDDEYYFVDVTFDDRVLTDGGGYLSHEYMLLNDAQSLKTHTPSGNGAKFKLPECSSTKYNYYVKNDLVIEDNNVGALDNKIKAIVKQSIENQETEFQIKISSSELANKIEKERFETGLTDSTISSVISQYHGVDYRGRTYNDIFNIYTFILEYDPK